jgi:hypothetical protein
VPPYLAPNKRFASSIRSLSPFFFACWGGRFLVMNVPLVSWHFTLMMCLIHHLPHHLAQQVAHRVTPRGWPRPAGERPRFFLYRIAFWWRPFPCTTSHRSSLGGAGWMRPTIHLQRYASAHPNVLSDVICEARAHEFF